MRWHDLVIILPFDGHGFNRGGEFSRADETEVANGGSGSPDGWWFHRLTV
jgi:hypothetical protein